MRQKKDNPYTEVLTHLIVDIFEKSNNAPINYKQVAAKLNLSDNESKDAILEILSDESKSGKFLQPERGKFQLRQLSVHIRGKVDMTADGSAYIVPDDELESDIHVAPRKRRRALDTDLLKVRVHARRRGRKRAGPVVEIIQRAKTDFTGTIDIAKPYALFLPDDRNTTHDIFVPLDNLSGAQHGETVV